MSKHELIGRIFLGVAWAMLIFSIVAFIASVAIWWVAYQLANLHPVDFGGLAVGILLIQSVVYGWIATGIGAFFAILGALIVAIVRRLLSLELVGALCLNALSASFPYFYCTFLQ
jgi:hypothetical protein